MKKTSLLKRVYMVAAIVFLCSYTIEQIIGTNVNITFYSFGIMLCLLSSLILARRKIRISTKADILLSIFIFYVLLHGLARGDDIGTTLSLILGSFFPYYLGRQISTNDSHVFGRYWRIAGVLIIGGFLLTLEPSSISTRGGPYKEAVIAIGEIFGVIALFMVGRYLEKRSAIYLLLGQAVVVLMSSVLGTRGSVFSLLLAMLIWFRLYLDVIPEAQKTFAPVFAPWFILLVISRTHFIECIPALRRFTWDVMLSDPSIVGSSEFLGRFDLFRLSIRAFAQNPIFGVGYGRIYSHNILLEVMSSYGLVGLCLFLAWAFSIVNFKTVEVTKRNQTLWQVFVCLLYIGFCRMMSFPLMGHKSLFVFGGIYSTSVEEEKKRMYVETQASRYLLH